MPASHVLDRLHARARCSPLLYRVTLATRYLFAMAFIPTGSVKALGLRFTTISPETPIGAFFEAMYQTDEYWRFIGLSQIVAGLLLIVPRTALLGAVAFFPIVLNIFVITWALEFRGTVYITGAMVCGAASLLAWDWHRLRDIVTFHPVAPDAEDRSRWIAGLGPWWERAAWLCGLACGLTMFFSTRSFITSPGLLIGVLGLGATCVVVALVGLIRAMKAAR